MTKQSLSLNLAVGWHQKSGEQKKRYRYILDAIKTRKKFSEIARELGVSTAYVATLKRDAEQKARLGLLDQNDYDDLTSRTATGLRRAIGIVSRTDVAALLNSKELRYKGCRTELNGTHVKEIGRDGFDEICKWAGVELPKFTPKRPDEKTINSAIKTLRRAGLWK